MYRVLIFGENYVSILSAKHVITINRNHLMFGQAGALS